VIFSVKIHVKLSFIQCKRSNGLSVFALSLVLAIRKKFRIGTSLAELAVVRASRMKIVHFVTVINTTFPVTEKVIYTFIYYYLMENRPYI